LVRARFGGALHVIETRHGRRQLLQLRGHLPAIPAVLHKYVVRLPDAKTFKVRQALGGWAEVRARPFADGAICDEIVVKR